MSNRSRYKSYAWTHPKTKLLYARVQIKQPDGKVKTYLKPATNKKHAAQLGDEMMADYEKRRTGFVEGERMTFDDLAIWYIAKRVQPPVYSEIGEKLSGMRTYKNVKGRIERMQKIFGKKLIKDIDENYLETIKAKLKKESPDALPASINRYLEDLRAMLKVAVRKRWLRENPFDFGEKLIDTALERKRDVTLTEDEEFALLHFAKKSEKSTLYYAMLCLLETGARPSEIYDASTVKAEPVTWQSFFDFDFRAVRLVSLKGTQRVVRVAPVTARLESAMRELRDSLKEDEQGEDRQIFEVKSFKRAYGTARRSASIALKIAAEKKIPVRELLSESFPPDKYRELVKEHKTGVVIINVRLRDMRRHLSTRLASLGMENDLRQRILGHTQAQTTFDYTAADLRTALTAKEMLDGGNQTLISEAEN